MAACYFHPAVDLWFRKTFGSETECQKEAWTAIREGNDTLIAAPTGSGKTLAGFLSAIDALIREAENGTLSNETRIVYVSPLKALSNDIRKNLEAPLSEILELQAQNRTRLPPVTAMVRTGDTSASERRFMARSPPHILVTTPESLYILLTSKSGRLMLSGVRTVIIDEIHALIQSKRGAHLALSLVRLEQLARIRPQRIGLSATQRPIQRVADFLTGGKPCKIIDQGHLRTMELSIELPESPLEFVLSTDQSRDVFDKMARLVKAHGTTLIFVNTRRISERIARALTERLGEATVSSHHGSLSRTQRLDAEDRLRKGQLKALVATASLELGIDVGNIDLVIQFGSTRSISTLIQRIGRSGHFREGIPKGCLFPTSRDDLIECIALLRAIRLGQLETLEVQDQPLDVLSQQIVAMVACEELPEKDLYQSILEAWPYRNLSVRDYTAIIELLATGFSTAKGPRAAYLHHDQVHGMLRPRPNARLTATTCGGTIPDRSEYRVILEPEGEFIGTVDEDFAIESMVGDIFQLGNASWRVLKVEQSVLKVEDARHQPPSMPFWFGEAPGRSLALSETLGDFRDEIEQCFLRFPGETGVEHAINRICLDHQLSREAARQAVHYLYLSHCALGCLPTQKTIVIERFLDEANGMQLIIHAPIGSRANRAWGLALRKRFCRNFNFELQAAATEDCVLLSLGSSQSFELSSVSRFLTADSVRNLLIQALLDAPMFTARWRWNALTSLAVKRFQSGRKALPFIIRMQCEDLITSVFPDQLACLENIVGDRTIPDHPLVQQTIDDCLTEAMDIDRLISVLEKIESGTIRVEVRDLREPSPLAAEIVHARAYNFLDDAPLEERRTRAVRSRRWLDISEAGNLSVIAQEALISAAQEAWPRMTHEEGVHDALLTLGYILDEEFDETQKGHLETLSRSHRAGTLKISGIRLWISTERLPLFLALESLRNPGSQAELVQEDLESWIPAALRQKDVSGEDALKTIIRLRMSSMAPRESGDLAKELGLMITTIDSALFALEAEGILVRGNFSPEKGNQWCDRQMLSRIHRVRIRQSRFTVSPVPHPDFMRFLFHWQGITRNPPLQEASGLAFILEQLEGFEAPARSWEREILPARLLHYDPAWMDQLCLSGRFAWLRIYGRKTRTPSIATIGISLVKRRNLSLWEGLGTSEHIMEELSSTAHALLMCLRNNGALFFDDLLKASGLIASQAEKGILELIARGLLHADGFSGLRTLLLPELQRQRFQKRSMSAMEESGRWNLLKRPPDPNLEAEIREATLNLALETWLKRYGIIFKSLIAREESSLPWSELMSLLRRKEARGEIRSGRFISGVEGQQFAHPEAAEELSRMSAQKKDGAMVLLSARDPLCLPGIFTPSFSLPQISGNRVAYRDGIPIALRRAGKIEFLTDVGSDSLRIRESLIRGVRL